ncbi:MAG: hypothetical protein Q606_CBAC00402G0014 [Intestinibacter bartlettii DORA_8_9]|uniref:Uncharacterized protein n=1 Tax=Intestinibacter bartlettii TaxID=261299 RepID=A0A6N3F633_9FIRM|nr:MAG: hypothetical protein Q606_CBAC00402G0014 [Intestinibacter bartlettii DORA_8_9]
MGKENVLLIDQDFQPLTEEECQNLKPIMKQFMESYIKHKDTMELDKWLALELRNNLDRLSEDEAKKISQEIIDSLKTDEESRESLKNAVKQGRSKESWFASQVKNATSRMGTKQTVNYLQELDESISTSNQRLYDTILTKSNSISQNPNLDGFIAEQYHAQTFNMNAKASGSQYRAEVLEPNGHGYGKNSVDIVIKDTKGKIVRKYQSKYCKDSKSTKRAFDHGDYRGQRKLVADGQEELIKNASNVIESPDGVKSNSLSKDDALKMRDEAQKNGKISNLDLNQCNTKQIAMNIGKQVGGAALQGAAIGVGMDIAQKIWRGEKVEASEEVEIALKSGADMGVKVAITGALKVAAEKGIVKSLEGTPAGTIANIVHVAVENTKIAVKVAKGEMTVKEGMNESEMTTVSVIGGLAGMAKGAEIGTGIGTIAGPIGAGIGGFIGGTVGYMAGSKVGDMAVEGKRKLTSIVKEKIKLGTSKISSKIKDNCVTRKLSFWFS